jgi:rod shape-determining protein MreD
MKKITILVIILYCLALLETSFFVHFNILTHYNFYFLNSIFILIVLWNLFEKRENFSGILVAFTGGFFLDVFSSQLIGFNISIAIIIALFIKLVFKKYVQIPSIKRA